eukprot:Tbor_TRINITY_DN5094_c0_g1::TRINITY_DN5094_c0_g1_i1::g.14252::m.14252
MEALESSIAVLTALVEAQKPDQDALCTLDNKQSLSAIIETITDVHIPYIGAAFIRLAAKEAGLVQEANRVATPTNTLHNDLIQYDDKCNGGIPTETAVIDDSKVTSDGLIIASRRLLSFFQRQPSGPVISARLVQSLGKHLCMNKDAPWVLRATTTKVIAAIAMATVPRTASAINSDDKDEKDTSVAVGGSTGEEVAAAVCEVSINILSTDLMRGMQRDIERIVSATIKRVNYSIEKSLSGYDGEGGAENGKMNNSGISQDTEKNDNISGKSISGKIFSGEDESDANRGGVFPVCNYDDFQETVQIPIRREPYSPESVVSRDTLGMVFPVNDTTMKGDPISGEIKQAVDAFSQTAKLYPLSAIEAVNRAILGPLRAFLASPSQVASVRNIAPVTVTVLESVATIKLHIEIAKLLFSKNMQNALSSNNTGVTFVDYCLADLRHALRESGRLCVAEWTKSSDSIHPIDRNEEAEKCISLKCKEQHSADRKRELFTLFFRKNTKLCESIDFAILPAVVASAYRESMTPFVPSYHRQHDVLYMSHNNADITAVSILSDYFENRDTLESLSRLPMVYRYVLEITPLRSSPQSQHKLPASARMAPLFMDISSTIKDSGVQPLKDKWVFIEAVDQLIAADIEELKEAMGADAQTCGTSDTLRFIGDVAEKYGKSRLPILLTVLITLANNNAPTQVFDIPLLLELAMLMFSVPSVNSKMANGEVTAEPSPKSNETAEEKEARLRGQLTAKAQVAQLSFGQSLCDVMRAIFESNILGSRKADVVCKCIDIILKYCPTFYGADESSHIAHWIPLSLFEVLVVIYSDIAILAAQCPQGVAMLPSMVSPLTKPLTYFESLLHKMAAQIVELEHSRNAIFTAKRKYRVAGGTVNDISWSEIQEELTNVANTASIVQTIVMGLQIMSNLGVSRNVLEENVEGQENDKKSHSISTMSVKTSWHRAFEHQRAASNISSAISTSNNHWRPSNRHGDRDRPPHRSTAPTAGRKRPHETDTEDGRDTPYSRKDPPTRTESHFSNHRDVSGRTEGGSRDVTNPHRGNERHDDYRNDNRRRPDYRRPDLSHGDHIRSGQRDTIRYDNKRRQQYGR